MWVLTTDGMFSAVVWTHNDEHHGKMCVRGREKKPLENLRKRRPADVTKVAVSPNGDYRYRVWCSRETWAELCAEIAGEIDYSNFKSAVLKKQGASRYEKALHQVWSVLSRIQPGGPYGRGGSMYPKVPKGEPKAAPTALRSSLSGSFELGNPPATTTSCFFCGDDEATKLNDAGRYVCVDLQACLSRPLA